jgi:hypothetical protein
MDSLWGVDNFDGQPRIFKDRSHGISYPTRLEPPLDGSAIRGGGLSDALIKHT